LSTRGHSFLRVMTQWYRRLRLSKSGDVPDLLSRTYIRRTVNRKTPATPPRGFDPFGGVFICVEGLALRCRQSVSSSNRHVAQQSLAALFRLAFHSLIFVFKQSL